MCGIAGVFGSNAASRVRSITQNMIHRGPDGEGLWTANSNIALGHRRLAINDLSDSGRQPMVSSDGHVVIVVNGEIYNYPELRHQLEKRGCRFTSGSDSEIVLHAWKHWGKNCFHKFNGMFAIGLFDVIQNQLILARDRLGIKPLYFYHDEGELVFASEIRALLAGLTISPGIDPVGLNQYLIFQNCFGDRCMREGIKMLRPGNILTYRAGKEYQLESFWNISFQPEADGISFETAVEQYQNTVNNAVGRHLMSDVPVACYLSAGFDSATVAARAATHSDPPVCFTGHFSEGGWYDETTTAASMAAHNGSSHVRVAIVPSDLPRIMDQLIRALDEPRMGMGAFPQYCVAEKVANTHKVVLTGHGGDELFSGYPVFKLVEIISLLSNEPLQALRCLLSLRPSEWPHLAYFLISETRPKPYRQYLPILNSPHSLQQGLRKEWAEAIHDLHGEDELLALDNNLHDRYQILYNHYLQAYLNGLLVVEDKLSMAHSLESRTPLLDNDMLNLSLSLSNKIKLHRFDLKAIIKEGGKAWLPGTLYEQPKRGFPTPLRLWLRGPLRSWFEERITGPESGLRVIFDDRWLKQTCTRYLYSSKQRIRPLDEIQSHRMWQLLSLESWLRQMV